MSSREVWGVLTRRAIAVGGMIAQLCHRWHLYLGLWMCGGVEGVPFTATSLAISVQLLYHFHEPVLLWRVVVLARGLAPSWGTPYRNSRNGPGVNSPCVGCSAFGAVYCYFWLED